MSKIYDYIQRDKFRALVEQYAGIFNIPVLLLDENDELLVAHPEDATRDKLVSRPLSVRDRPLGYIATSVSDKSTEPALDFMERNLSELLNAGYEIDSLSGEVARNYEELSLLWHLTSRLGVGLNVDNICQVLADEVMKICPSTNISVHLLSEAPTKGPDGSCAISPEESTSDENHVTFFVPMVSLGRDADSASTMALNTDHELMREVYTRKEPITICEVSKDKRFEGFTYPVIRVLVVPLIVEDEVIGAVVASDKLDGEEFFSNEIKLIMSIATECAVSIKKALLYDEIHDMLFSTAEALSLAMDAKDPYTYGHSKRVSQLTVNIAKSLGQPEDTTSRIRLAALLHDIGKLGTPEVILGKVSSLEPEEMDTMKEHPLAGARMLENIRRMREIATWICHHHEKYDGSGYPSGLKGDQIPLPSRIISLADYYDALTSDRPYRKALSREEAINIMRESVGTHFDPVVYEHFIKVTSRT